VWIRVSARERISVRKWNCGEWGKRGGEMGERAMRGGGEKGLEGLGIVD